MNITLFGAEAEKLHPLIDAHESLTLVEKDPDVVVCFGGDGTLLASELKWPSVPKVPLRNSRRGIRCISDPPEKVLELLANGQLIRKEHLKLECTVHHSDPEHTDTQFLAINECNLHMARTNSSVRFQVWFDDKPYGTDHEVIGDGFVVCTPFGSTAYFNQITRGVFWCGMGVAFKYTSELTNHLIVPDDTVIRARITRGPAILAYDNSSEYVEMIEGDEIRVSKHDKPAIMLTTDA